MKTIEEEFPPEGKVYFEPHLAELYTRLRARAVEMERALAGTQKIPAYYETCKRAYGSRPSEYENGVLQGIECALVFLPPAPEIHQTKP